MKRLLLVVVLLFTVTGCAFLGSLFKPDVGPDGKPRSLGRDLGGAVQMVIEGEWIAGGVAGLAAIFAATARHFFRRGEKAEKRKVGEIAYAVEKTMSGEPVNEVLATTELRAPIKKAKAKKVKKQPA